ncbi:MAG: peptidoglycan-binding protein [Bacteroidia bacterium]|nr:peptidoglycan-binding protein [Bacteroidia bacterium]NNF31437.1 peptidoglycan-binding protein [Flavobacteriaceae bacterium]NNJ80890.1 peptidoglycan-binding protein [Flavobacteriaceae bacterium]NNK54016.1 peptidoglycan-binding protein [Flavobacteriaceae bacterium]NNM07593.1 peptidoglycan-binding protein [Flavobacteriaceae bacterium]
MKQIIIFLLIVIIGLIGWGQYKKYKRFSLTEYEYKIPENLKNSERKDLLLDYFEAVEALNGHVITQWSAYRIDVRNPKKDNNRTQAAVSEYRNKRANVKYYEQQLLDPETQKEPSVVSEEEKKKQLLRKQFYANPSANSLRLREQNAMVFEIQGLLISKGHIIEHDGLFRAETFNALKAFEEKSGLFPDGKLDAITLEYLLK